jgi:uncharacterized protein (TIGR00730 family)
LGNDDIYAVRARELGEWMAANGHGLVYGAGSVGLMGVVADAVVCGGGEAIGVIPEFLMGREVDHRGLSETHVVTDMHERKRMMIDLADAFIALPGGAGTLEEITEVISWQGLGLMDKACIVYNVGGYYDSLRTFFDRMAQEGFLAERPRADVHFPETLTEVASLLYCHAGAVTLK